MGFVFVGGSGLGRRAAGAGVQVNRWAGGQVDRWTRTR